MNILNEGYRGRDVPFRRCARPRFDLLQAFRTIDYMRDWLPIQREQCAKVGSRKSRWSRSSARQIAIRFRRSPSGTGSASRRSTLGASVSAACRRPTSGRHLETENARLKKLVAERDLEIEVMKEVAAKNW